MDLNLQDLRKQIDEIDGDMLRLLKERMDVAARIAEYKKEHRLPVFDPVREREKLSAISDSNARKLFATLFELSRDEQRRILSGQGEKRILVINGPNLNLLGVREPQVYGTATYADLLDFIKDVCEKENVEVECMQSNHEGEIVDAIQAAYGKFDGIVINPAAYTHTSIAIYDALKAVGIRAVEVHLSDVQAREEFRKVSYAGKACEKTFAGMGFAGYESAIKNLV